jgi:hypothetical protein
MRADDVRGLKERSIAVFVERDERFNLDVRKA